MIVICVTNCPPQLRGDLTKWMLEVNTGVYVGKLNARVRQELWKRVCDNIKTGQATMIYSSNSEQGYSFLNHNSTWIPIDFEGVSLIKKLFTSDNCEEEKDLVLLEKGFSKASKLLYCNRSKQHRMQRYTILDIETTGLNPEKDRIIEIGILRIVDGKVQDKYHKLINAQVIIPDNIIELTGITQEMIESEGVSEETAIGEIIDFIQQDIILGYNINFDLDFLDEMAIREACNFSITKCKDIMEIARRKINGLVNYQLDTVAAYFNIDVDQRHRALLDCEIAKKIYDELNKI